MKLYPSEKGRGEKSFSYAEGGGTTSFGVVFTRKLEVLAIFHGGTKSSTI